MVKLICRESYYNWPVSVCVSVCASQKPHCVCVHKGPTMMRLCVCVSQKPQHVCVFTKALLQHVL